MPENAVQLQKLAALSGVLRPMSVAAALSSQTIWEEGQQETSALKKPKNEQDQEMDGKWRQVGK